MKGGCEAEGRVGGVNNEKGILTHGNGCCEHTVLYSVLLLWKALLMLHCIFPLQGFPPYTLYIFLLYWMTFLS